MTGAALSPLLERTTPAGRFDRVVSAETVYTLEAAEQMAVLVSRHLARPHGVALIGAKRYWLRHWRLDRRLPRRRAKREPALECEAALVIDNGHSNIRGAARPVAGASANFTCLQGHLRRLAPRRRRPRV